MNTPSSPRPTARRKVGQSPLTWDDSLAKAAQAWADDPASTAGGSLHHGAMGSRRFDHGVPVRALTLRAAVVNTRVYGAAERDVGAIGGVHAVVAGGRGTVQCLGQKPEGRVLDTRPSAVSNEAQQDRTGEATAGEKGRRGALSVLLIKFHMLPGGLRVTSSMAPGCRAPGLGSTA
ncbi:CAP domain-containing protein [Streptomyces mirabilis]|uniref:CAP domain-containing protein n=1 Tax=Streptomyces mirabilis TaxID=68239 RepID=UPI00332377DE